MAMAGAFSRCGQTTLGLSPALAGRLACAPPSAAGASIPDMLPFFYRTVERVRRRVATAFAAPLEALRLSDATLTRLQPVGSSGGADEDEKLDEAGRRFRALRRARALRDARLALRRGAPVLDAHGPRGEELAWAMHSDAQDALLTSFGFSRFARRLESTQGTHVVQPVTNRVSKLKRKR